MGNTYLQAQQYVAMSIAALDQQSVLPMVFTRFPGGVPKGTKDDQVAVFRTPGITRARDYEWRTRTAPIVLDRIARTETIISLHRHLYNAVPVTDEEMTLDVTNFAREVVGPQATAVTLRAEGGTLKALTTEANFKHTNLNAAAADDPYDKALDWAATLDGQGTPQSGRKLLVGANVRKWIMKSESLVKYDLSQATTAYRKATFGQLANFDVVSSPLLHPNAIFAVHPTALVIANTAPAALTDGTYSATASNDNWSMRIVRSFDINYARTISMLSTFAGFAPVQDELEMEKDDQGMFVPKLTEGEPVYTGKNVRGASGTFTPAP